MSSTDYDVIIIGGGPAGVQQATVAIRAQIPLEVMSDVIQPFPTFSESLLHGLTELGAKVPAAA